MDHDDDPPTDRSRGFIIFVIITSVFIFIVLVMNTVFYSRVYKANGNAQLTASAALWLAILNGFFAAISGIIMLWAIAQIVVSSRAVAAAATRAKTTVQTKYQAAQTYPSQPVSLGEVTPSGRVVTSFAPGNIYTGPGGQQFRCDATGCTPLVRPAVPAAAPGGVALSALAPTVQAAQPTTGVVQTVTRPLTEVTRTITEVHPSGPAISTSTPATAASLAQLAPSVGAAAVLPPAAAQPVLSVSAPAPSLPPVIPVPQTQAAVPQAFPSGFPTGGLAGLTAVQPVRVS